MPPPFAMPVVLRVLPFAAAVLALSACSKQAPPVAAVRPVLVRPAGTGEADAAGYTGEVRARHESDLGFRIGGKIVARLVDTGAVVAAGQPLARLDPGDAALQASQAEANRALAEAELKRYRDLRAKNFVSQATLDAKETAFKSADAQAALARNQSSYTTLSADHAGVVTAVLAEVGQVVAPGQPVIRVARPEEKEVAINVPEGRVEELRKAPSLVVSPWAQPELRLAGRVREIAPAADAATRTFAARITIEGATAAVQLGMTARVALPPAGSASGILVPLTAVVDQGQGPAVWIVADGKAQRRPVQIGQIREDGVLLASGVRPGELVVVVGAHKLVPDQPVKAVIEAPGAGAAK